MNNLRAAVNALRSLFDPESSAPVIWEPLETDQNASIKRELIAKSEIVLSAGSAALKGEKYKPFEFGDAEFEAIEQLLSEDVEQKDFFALASASKRVAVFLSEAVI